MVDFLLLKAQGFQTVLICLSLHTVFTNKIKDGQNNCLMHVPELQILFKRNMKTGWLRAGKKQREGDGERQWILCGISDFCISVAVQQLCQSFGTYAVSGSPGQHCISCIQKYPHHSFSNIFDLISTRIKHKPLGRERKKVRIKHTDPDFDLFFKLKQCMLVVCEYGQKPHLAGAPKSLISLNL